MNTGFRLATLILLTLPGCGEREPPAPSGPDVFLITIDTLRADHLETYGYTRPTSPFIKSLSEECVIFDNAITPCPSTAPAVASILTGQHRARHTVVQNGYLLPEDVVSMAEVLKGRGYRTIGLVANPVIINEEGGCGFEQGFDEYYMPADMPRTGDQRYDGASVPQEVESLLDTRGSQPLFLWVHLVEPHGPYNPPERYRAEFPPESYTLPGPETLPLSESNYGYNVIPQYQMLGVPPESTVQDFLAAYDAEIRYVDEHVQRIVTAIRSHGSWDDSLFILASDHGESLGEHDYYFQHGYHLHDGSLRVPLMIRSAERFKQGSRVAQSVSLVDILPTMLELLGLDSLEGLEGQSLVPLMESEASDRIVYSQTYYGNRLSSIQRGSIRYIFTPPPPTADRDSRWEDGWKGTWPTQSSEALYDLAQDPGENRSLIPEAPTYLDALKRTLKQWLREQNQISQRRKPRFREDRGAAEALRALGYTK